MSGDRGEQRNLRPHHATPGTPAEDGVHTSERLNSGPGNARRACAALLLTALALPTGWTQQPGAMQRFRRDDRDGDGNVTREEFSGGRRLFERLDRNADGAVEPAELRPGSREPAAQHRRRPFTCPEDLVLHRDIVYGRAGDTDLKLDLLLPRDAAAEPRPLIVFVHGGAFRAGDKASALPKLVHMTRAGYVCATVNYRLSGTAVFPAQIEDCKCAVRFLRAHAARYGIDPARVGAWGSSAGGHLVTMLGAAGDVAALEGTGGWQNQSSRVQAVCNWFGPANLLSMATQQSRMDHNGQESPEAQLIGGPVLDHPDKARRASPITYITPDDPPILIMHGTTDPIVPFPQSEELAAACRNAGLTVEFVPLTGAGHGGPQFAAPETMAHVIAFFDRHLK